MIEVMQQYGTAAQPGTVYYCDDSSDLDAIKNPPMGAVALIIHEKAALYIADSKGVWFKI